MTFRYREPRFGGTGYGHIREWAFEGDPKAILQVGETERILRYQDRHILYALSGRYSVKQGGTARDISSCPGIINAGREFFCFNPKARKASRLPYPTCQFHKGERYCYVRKDSLQNLLERGRDTETVV